MRDPNQLAAIWADIGERCGVLHDLQHGHDVTEMLGCERCVRRLRIVNHLMIQRLHRLKPALGEPPMTIGEFA